jgi:hypothetical protein
VILFFCSFVGSGDTHRLHKDKKSKKVPEPPFFSLHGRKHVGSRTASGVESETNVLPLFLYSRKLPNTVITFATNSID